VHKHRTNEFWDARNIVCFKAPFRHKEGSEKNDSDNKEGDDGGRVPGVFASSPDKGENDTDTCPQEEYEANVVDFLELER
jgi:hypothetical protein